MARRRVKRAANGRFLKGTKRPAKKKTSRRRRRRR
jgi:hypothetical protein